MVPYYSRAASREAPGLAGHEIVWIDNALDAFMLEVQGSGRVQLTTGETIRLQYEDQNGHPYRSIGKYLADQGVMTIDQVNMPAIRAWLARQSAAPARSARQQSERGVLPRGAARRPIRSGRKARWACR